MWRKPVFLLILLALLTGCAGTTDQRREELRGTMEALARPQIPTATIRVRPSPTPRPTPTLFALPAYIGTPYLADPGLEQAMTATLAGMGAEFEIAFFTRSASGAPLVWVTDRRYPRLLLCGAPLYLPGLGSLLILSSSTLYESLSRSGVVTARQGCLAASLEKGELQARQILERFQAYYAASRDGRSFSSPEELETYTQQFLAGQQGKSYPYELNLATIALDYIDRGNISLALTQRTSGFDSRTNWQFRSASAPFETAGSPVKHAAMVFARTLEVTSNQGVLALVGPRVKAALQNAPAVSLYKSSPLSQQEILSARLSYDFWQTALFGLQRLAGLRTVTPNMSEDYAATNPYFAPILALSGFPAAQSFTDPPEWTAFNNFIQSRTSLLDYASVDKVLLRLRNYAKDSYLTITPYEDKQ